MDTIREFEATLNLTPDEAWTQRPGLTTATTADQRPRPGPLVDKPMALVGRKHPALHQEAARVDNADAGIYDLANRMILTLGLRNGYALSACQVGQPIALVVLGKGLAYINPHVTVLDQGVDYAGEECLSIPGRAFTVPRAPRVRVSAFDLTLSEPVTAEFVGSAARMWQHEADHLAGTLISDLWPEVRRGG